MSRVLRVCVHSKEVYQELMQVSSEKGLSRESRKGLRKTAQGFLLTTDQDLRSGRLANEWTQSYRIQTRHPPIARTHLKGNKNDTGEHQRNAEAKIHRSSKLVRVRAVSSRKSVRHTA